MSENEELESMQRDFRERIAPRGNQIETGGRNCGKTQATINILQSTIADRDREIERLNNIIKLVQKRDNEIEQVLGKVLGYPAFRDDPKNFPEVKPDDDSVCVGEHVPVTIAMEAAKEIERLREVLEDFMSYFSPDGGVSQVPLGPFERAKALKGE